MDDEKELEKPEACAVTLITSAGLLNCVGYYLIYQHEGRNVDY
jgi:hypothetical protein